MLPRRCSAPAAVWPRGGRDGSGPPARRAPGHPFPGVEPAGVGGADGAEFHAAEAAGQVGTGAAEGRAVAASSRSIGGGVSRSAAMRQGVFAVQSDVGKL